MLFPYVLILLSLLSSLSSSTSLPSSSISLLQFHQSLSLSSQHLLPWINQSHHHSSSPCQWVGVSCTNKFHIKSLNLFGFGLLGILNKSISHLYNLNHLISLDLSYNNFEGPIPSQLFLSKQLLQLDLGFNFLTGRIPTEVSLCIDLEYLGLYNNYLSGEIPREIFLLPNLKYLYLNTNNLTGTLPNFLLSCSIIDLWVHENMLSGPLPPCLENCSNITTFFASQNGFEGIIPSEIFKGVLGLKILYLDSNEFVGELPETLWDLRNLQELVFSGNKLNGSVPEGLGRCQRLTIIALSVISPRDLLGPRGPTHVNWINAQEPLMPRSPIASPLLSCSYSISV